MFASANFCMLAVWFLGVLIREHHPGSSCFWVVLKMSKKNSHRLCFSKLLFVIVSEWGLGFKCQAGPVSTNSKLLGL